jgi:ABC-type sugar transport system ATPase subunit
VDFELRAGEIHAILGENGAGKSTLIKVLGGVLEPDAGAVRIDGRPVRIASVRDADIHGIRIIHQELALAPNLSVAENIYLGREPSRFGLIRRGRMRSDARRLLAELGLAEHLPIDARVGALGTGRRQLVEIARALAAPLRILVLDEPTASLSKAESEILFARLRFLRERGVGIVLISHRLDEVAAIADRVTVLRDGKTVGGGPATGDAAAWVRLMVGREVAQFYPRPTSIPGDVAMRVTDLHAPGVNGASFELRRGEILGFAGLVGAGRTELANALIGRTRIKAGTVEIDGRSASIRDPAEARRAGIVLVPEDRKRSALVLPRSIAFNAAWPWTDRWIRGIRPDASRRAAIARKVVEEFEVRARSIDQPVRTLSGGNQQKVVVGRWMEEPPRVLILDEPTRGVDVGARADLYRIIHRLADRGMAVVLISSDLQETLNIAHRVAVYRAGRIVEILAAAEATPDRVMASLARSDIA